MYPYSPIEKPTALERAVPAKFVIADQAFVNELNFQKSFHNVFCSVIL